MSLGQAITISRSARNITRKELTDVGYTDSMLGKVERGERRLGRDVAPTMAEKLDHPALYYEIARDLTGGVGPAYLDGPNVDLHRASVREKCLEELTEAYDWISKSAASRPPDAETDGERRRRRDHLIQVLDAQQACAMYVAVQCEEYGFSMLQLYRDHHQKLKGLRYLKS